MTERGAKFWSDRQCLHGHVNEQGQTERLVKYRNCVQCANERSAIYRADPANKAKRKEADKRWRESNPKAVREALYRWRDKNKQHYRDYQREYRRQYIKDNPDKIAEIYERWQANKSNNAE